MSTIRPRHSICHRFKVSNWSCKDCGNSTKYPQINVLHVTNGANWSKLLLPKILNVNWVVWMLLIFISIIGSPIVDRVQPAYPHMGPQTKVVNLRTYCICVTGLVFHPRLVINVVFSLLCIGVCVKLHNRMLQE